MDNKQALEALDKMKKWAVFEVENLPEASHLEAQAEKDRVMELMAEALRQSILVVDKFNEQNQITEKGKDYLVDWKQALAEYEKLGVES